MFSVHAADESVTHAGQLAKSIRDTPADLGHRMPLGAEDSPIRRLRAQCGTRRHATTTPGTATLMARAAIVRG
jgi:hypothetical protein